MKMLNVPITNMSKLKKSPSKVIQEATDAKNGIYIFNRDTPVAVIMSSTDYEKMVLKEQKLEEEILDLKVEKEALQRIENHSKDSRTFSEKDIFGQDGLDNIDLDENDGWE